MKKTVLIAICFFCLVNFAWGETDLKEITKLAESGDAKYQLALGFKYEQGIGVPQNYAEAIKWYRKSADQGYAKAQTRLGLMYDNGQGVSQNYIEAVKWYRKAAEQEDVEGQGYLGFSYALGTGVPQNLIKAYVWLSLASANGSQPAKKALEEVRSEMTPQQVAQAQKEAAELLEKINKSKK
jgi:TPR repeat protein